jgi:hypothetical protein
VSGAEAAILITLPADFLSPQAVKLMLVMAKAKAKYLNFMVSPRLN